MDRKNFLKQSALVSLGGLLFPSSILSSCRKKSLFEDQNYDGKVIIIGAGAAGLYAGYILKSKGIDFTILEASNTHGGRMGKLSGFADYDIDTGAQWLHGNNNILGDLIKKTNTPVTLDLSEYAYWFNGQLVSELPEDPFIFEGENLPDVSFKDYAHQQGFGSEYDTIIEAIAGDQGASASLLSAYWNKKEEENWVSGDDDFKFSATYFDFIDAHIARPVIDKVVLNTPITGINYAGEKIQLTDASSNQWIADKVIVTVPISILKLNEISFTPALPAAKTEAFSKIGMGPGMKVFLKFSTKFFEPILIGGTICAAYIDDSVGKTTSDNILLAFVMGDQAAYLHALGSDNAITTALLQELDSVYSGQATASFLASSVHDYTSKPFIKGAYGYSTVGMNDARAVAAQPVNDKLFFAGEAMNINGHHQTVQGAVESGYKAVIDLLKSVEK
ncbi:MAG: flavin monoamine oxidase family protein [Bacteroidota bacterium]|jgi:monoamine oxidase